VLPFILLWVVAFPMFILLGLRANSDKLNTTQVKLKYGFMYREYKIEYYYWEFIKMYMKLLIMLILNQYAMEIRVKGTLICWVICFYAVMQYNLRPYMVAVVGDMDTFSTVVCAMSMFCGVFIYRNEFNHWIGIALFLLAVINIICLLRILFAIVAEYNYKFDLWLDKYKRSIHSCYPFTKEYILLSRHYRNQCFWQKLKVGLLNELRKDRKREYRKAIIALSDPSKNPWDSPSPRKSKQNGAETNGKHLTVKINASPKLKQRESTMKYNNKSETGRSDRNLLIEDV